MEKGHIGVVFLKNTRLKMSQTISSVRTGTMSTLFTIAFVKPTSASTTQQRLRKYLLSELHKFMLK